MPVCFNKRCRKEKNQISNLFFPIYDNEKKIKNESNGMKERAWGHENGFTIGCGVVRLNGTIAVSDDSENLRTCGQNLGKLIDILAFWFFAVGFSSHEAVPPGAKPEY